MRIQHARSAQHRILMQHAHDTQRMKRPAAADADDDDEGRDRVKSRKFHNMMQQGELPPGVEELYTNAAKGTNARGNVRNN